jgi:uncharacterized protein (DUF488 family)
MSDERAVYSIGHSNHALADFVALLEASSITALADVRSQPVSRRNPHFDKQELEAAVRERGFVYVFMGEQLGGRPNRASLFDSEGRADYERMCGADDFQRGLDRLETARGKFTVAMMCAEEDPLDCHRGLLIAPALGVRGVDVKHIRGDGTIESTAQMEERLLGDTDVGRWDGLFAATLSDDDRREMLAEAYRRMARKKAFRLKPGQTPGSNPHFGDDGDMNS